MEEINVERLKCDGREDWCEVREPCLRRIWGENRDRELRESYVGEAGSADRWRIVLIFSRDAENLCWKTKRLKSYIIA